MLLMKLTILWRNGCWKMLLKMMPSLASATINIIQTTVQSIVHFLGGFVARKAIKAFQCQACKEDLLSDSTDTSNPVAALTSVCDKGGLLWPSKTLLSQLICLENCISRVLKSFPLFAGMMQMVLSKIAVTSPHFAIGCIVHSTEILKYITRGYEFVAEIPTLSSIKSSLHRVRRNGNGENRNPDSPDQILIHLMKYSERMMMQVSCWLIMGRSQKGIFLFFSSTKGRETRRTFLLTEHSKVPGSNSNRSIRFTQM